MARIVSHTKPRLQKSIVRQFECPNCLNLMALAGKPPSAGTTIECESCSSKSYYPFQSKKTSVYLSWEWWVSGIALGLASSILYSWIGKYI